MISIEEVYTLFVKHPVVCTDTRNIVDGSLFFALKGANFNGNQFAEKALEQGCAFVVIDEPEYKIDDRCLLVPDVLTTLQELAHYHRTQLKLPVIAITGSNGKTTTKELVHAVLSKKYRAYATVGNLNNHIGVPLTLLSLTTEHEVAVVEMGANHQKEIELLCKIAAPDFGIITNIGKAHLEGFGGIEGVKKGKGELFDYLRTTGGKAFVHGDDEVINELVTGLEKVTYGTKKLYDIVGKQLVNADEFISFQWATRYGAAGLAALPVVKTHLVGTYNYFNLLCAVAVGNYFQVDAALVNEALTNYQPSNQRSQLQKTNSNTLILDYYNANPSSMQLALDNFERLSHEHKMVVLGDMLELGKESEEEHEKIAGQLLGMKLEQVVLVGPLFAKIKTKAAFQFYADSDKAMAALKAAGIKDRLILLKGSRGIHLEKVLDAL